ncbi:MAG: hypothetical protein U1E78_11380 [Gammaproteobacteria bacterium]
MSPETQKLLANEIAASAVKLGFGDPSEIDIDSTVQEANMLSITHNLHNEWQLDR